MKTRNNLKCVIALMCAFFSSIVWAGETEMYYFNEYEQQGEGELATLSAGNDVPVGVTPNSGKNDRKYEIADNGERINFKKGYEITASDINEAIEEINNIYGVAPLVIDITEYSGCIKSDVNFVNAKARNFDEGVGVNDVLSYTLEEARDVSKIAPNCIIYLSEESAAYTNAKNVVVMKTGVCHNFVVTDRYPVKIPYAFKATKAVYERDKGLSDSAVEQAANSHWGTLCLPYPISNNSSDVTFYRLTGTNDSNMQFEQMAPDAVIPANTPVIYKRTKGCSSMVTIEESDVEIPVNANYETNPGDATGAWQFMGTLETKVYCGKSYNKGGQSIKNPGDAVFVDRAEADIYYFYNDAFTRLKETGKVTVLPYRAYFVKNNKAVGTGSSASSYSIIAKDEEGATDITSLIDNNTEADGKIYDLNGRRVMKPIKGSLYIVNGKKKIY